MHRNELRAKRAAFHSRSATLTIRGLFRLFNNAPGRAHTRIGDAMHLARAGQFALIVLAFILPFEFTQHPFIQTKLVTITNVKVSLYIVAALGLVYLLRRGAHDRVFWRSVERVRVPLGLLIGLLLSCVLSSALASERSNSLKWTLDTLVGGLLWLVIPLWLATQRERKIRMFAQVIVLGAVIASLAGILEFSFGAGYAESLRWFKPKPTLAGSFLRLSGTFEYANIAAMYFELALPLAVAGLVDAAAPRRSRGLVVFAWLAAVGILIEGILLTFSRGALLGIAASLTVSAVIVWRNHQRLVIARRQRIVLLIAGALAVATGAVTLTSTPLAVLRFTSQSDQQWYQASFHSQVPATMAACQRLTIPVTAENKSPFVWQPEGANVYNLGYHWLYPSGKVALFENPRSRLRAPVQPGGMQTIQATIRAPGKTGHYLLVWDMVQEQVTWFSLKSASYVGHPVVVRGPTPGAQACTGHASLVAVGRSGPAELPRTFSQPARTQLWKAALYMLKARPLLGIGPDAYRLRYGAYTKPPLKTWDTRILANELYLELFADLGFLGGGIFLGFLFAVWWPLIVALWARNRQILSIWHIGLVAAFFAFLGHGLVDDFIDSHAITLLVWLLCGLASTMSAELAAMEGR